MKPFALIKTIVSGQALVAELEELKSIKHQDAALADDPEAFDKAFRVYLNICKVEGLPMVDAFIATDFLHLLRKDATPEEYDAKRYEVVLGLVKCCVDHAVAELVAAAKAKSS